MLEAWFAAVHGVSGAWGDAFVAMISMLGAVLVVTLPILLRQHHLQRQITLGQDKTHAKVDDLIADVNSVEEGEALPDGGQTLGQAVRQIHDEVREGFHRNIEDHAEIRSHVESVQDTVRANSARLDRIEKPPRKRS